MSGTSSQLADSASYVQSPVRCNMIHDSVFRDHQGIRIIALFPALLACAAAHDIPSDATAQVYLKPAGQKLQLLVRVPLKTMRDVDFRERGQGFLDLEYLDP